MRRSFSARGRDWIVGSNSERVMIHHSCIGNASLEEKPSSTDYMDIVTRLLQNKKFVVSDGKALGGIPDNPSNTLVFGLPLNEIQSREWANSVTNDSASSLVSKA